MPWASSVWPPSVGTWLLSSLSMSAIKAISNTLAPCSLIRVSPSAQPEYP
jgi:hypothetical protein